MRHETTGVGVHFFQPIPAPGLRELHSDTGFPLIGPADPEIVALEARLRCAQLDSDVAALDELLDDALLFTGLNGEIATKAEDLESHASGAVRFREHEPTALHVRRVGETVAVTALRARLSVEAAGTLVQGTYCYTRIWAREDHGPWRVVGGHVSAVPEPALTHA